MEIRIDKNFVIKVPRFTDDLEDLHELYQINFGMFKFNSDDYESLNTKIILSKNDCWNKAIALLILNANLITKKIYDKVHKEEYPYYAYPYIQFKNKITFIVESLAINTIDKLIRDLKKNQNLKISTYVINAITYAFNKDGDQLHGTRSQIIRIPLLKKKQQQAEKWVDKKIKYDSLYGRPKRSYKDELAKVRKQIGKVDINANKFAKLKKQERQLVVLNENEPSKNIPYFVVIDEITLLPPKELNNTIDQNTHCFNNRWGSRPYATLQDKLDIVLDTLTDREDSVLRLRYYIDSFDDEEEQVGKVRSISDIARIFGVNEYRIRQIINKAIKKLKTPERSEQIQEFLNMNYEVFEIKDEHNQLPYSW